MNNDYLNDIESALNALSTALESVDLAEMNGLHVHPSIGNRLNTAKLMVAEVVASVIEDREKEAQKEPSYEPMSLNTKINYLYRDADNYKVYNECIINGFLTKEQQDAIISCLDEGTYFIPSLVGMPEVKFDEVDTEADHQWFELDESGFVNTIQKPDVSITPEELVSAFTLCKDHWIEFFVSDVGVWNLTNSEQNMKQSLDSLIHGASSRTVAAPQIEDKLACKVSVACGYGTPDNCIVDVYLDKLPKSAQEGNTSVILNQEEREEALAKAYFKATEIIGPDSASLTFICKTEIVQKEADLSPKISNTEPQR